MEELFNLTQNPNDATGANGTVSINICNNINNFKMLRNVSRAVFEKPINFVDFFPSLFIYSFIYLFMNILLGTNSTQVVNIQNVTTAPTQSGDVSTNFIIGMTAAYAVIFLVALFGNSFCLFVALKKSSSKRTRNLFIANMAVADLLLTFTMMPLSVVLFYRGKLWFGGTLGTVTCKALFFVIPISISASVFTLTFISFDRMYGIFYPLKEKIFQKPKFLSAIIWILSVVLMIPYVILLQVEYDPNADVYYCVRVFSSRCTPCPFS